jgi:hypothetical protein
MPRLVFLSYGALLLAAASTPAQTPASPDRVGVSIRRVDAQEPLPKAEAIKAPKQLPRSAEQGQNATEMPASPESGGDSFLADPEFVSEFPVETTTTEYGPQKHRLFGKRHLEPTDDPYEATVAVDGGTNAFSMLPSRGHCRWCWWRH